MKKILLTGSEGLIGSVLYQKLQKKFVISRFDLKIHQNILNKTQLDTALKDCDGVIHLAALSRVVTAYKKPMDAVKNNIVGTMNILESIRRSNSNIWCIYASSREVYGETKNRVKENNALNPINVYGVTKMTGELLMDVYETNYGIRSFVTRFSNVYGSLNDHKDRVIPKFMGQAASNSDITVYGGTQTFDFVHVDDATNGIIKLIEKITQKKTRHKKYHFVSGHGTNLITLARKIIEITNSKSKIKKMDARNYDVNYFVGDPSLTKVDLGWKTKISLDAGLRTYWNEFRKKI